MKSDANRMQEYLMSTSRILPILNRRRRHPGHQILNIVSLFIACSL
jgi:hypothetical protein